MKYFFMLVAVGTLLCSAADAAKWIEIANDPKVSIVYIDLDSIKATGINSYSAWTKWLFKDKQIYNGKRVWYRQSLNVYDCARNTSRNDSHVDYGADGSILDNYVRENYEKNAGLGFEDVVPDSYGEVVQKFICSFTSMLGKKLGRYQISHRDFYFA